MGERDLQGKPADSGQEKDTELKNRCIIYNIIYKKYPKNTKNSDGSNSNIISIDFIPYLYDINHIYEHKAIIFTDRGISELPFTHRLKFFRRSNSLNSQNYKVQVKGIG